MTLRLESTLMALAGGPVWVALLMSRPDSVNQTLYVAALFVLAGLWIVSAFVAVLAAVAGDYAEERLKDCENSLQSREDKG